jgi:hypothetical protein
VSVDVRLCLMYGDAVVCIAKSRFGVSVHGLVHTVSLSLETTLGGCSARLLMFRSVWPPSVGLFSLCINVLCGAAVA